MSVGLETEAEELRTGCKLDVVVARQTSYRLAMSKVVEDNFAEVWERTIQPGQADLTPDAARYFLKLAFAEADRARMDQLAEKARAGSLADEEEAALDHYMQLGWFLDLMKSKARLSLGLRPADASR